MGPSRRRQEQVRQARALPWSFLSHSLLTRSFIHAFSSSLLNTSSVLTQKHHGLDSTQLTSQQAETSKLRGKLLCEEPNWMTKRWKMLFYRGGQDARVKQSWRK